MTPGILQNSFNKILPLNRLQRTAVPEALHLFRPNHHILPDGHRCSLVQDLLQQCQKLIPHPPDSFGAKQVTVIFQGKTQLSGSIACKDRQIRLGGRIDHLHPFQKNLGIRRKLTGKIHIGKSDLCKRSSFRHHRNLEFCEQPVEPKGFVAQCIRMTGMVALQQFRKFFLFCITEQKRQQRDKHAAAPAELLPVPGINGNGQYKFILPGIASQQDIPEAEDNIVRGRCLGFCQFPEAWQPVRRHDKIKGFPPVGMQRWPQPVGR